MRYVYPSSIVLDEEERMTTGRVAYGVTFPDVPEAITCGWSWEEAIEMAEDCLGVALGMYVKANLDLPKPSPVRDGQVLVPVPLLVAAKLTIYTAMREQGSPTPLWPPGWALTRTPPESSSIQDTAHTSAGLRGRCELSGAPWWSRTVTPTHPSCEKKRWWRKQMLRRS